MQEDRAGTLRDGAQMPDLSLPPANIEKSEVRQVGWLLLRAVDFGDICETCLDLIEFTSQLFVLLLRLGARIALVSSQ